MIPVAKIMVMKMKNKIVTITLLMAVLTSSISCSSNTPSKASKKSGTPYTASSVTSYNVDVSDNFLASYVNREGDLLLDVDEHGYPLFYIKDSQILNY